MVDFSVAACEQAGNSESGIHLPLRTVSSHVWGIGGDGHEGQAEGVRGDALRVGCNRLRSFARGVCAAGLVVLGSQTLLPVRAVSQTIADASAIGREGLSASHDQPQVRSAGVVEVHGSVQDLNGAAVPDASVELSAEDGSRVLHAGTDGTGQVAFAGVTPGEYRVSVARPEFEAWHGSVRVVDGDAFELPAMALRAAALRSSVEVTASGHEIAEAQMQLEEKQRVLGVFPNFYASYAPDAEPLSRGQKFRLAWRFVNDPVALGIAGITAASEQRADTFHSYGGGASGFAKRYGAAYTDGFSSTFLGQALLPTLLHQDPRYFVKGTGSVGSRVLYAMASMMICKGDDRRWQPNYSNVLGNFASAGLSNVYYPAANRGAGLVVQNAMTATLLGAVGGLFQEFLLHRMTPGIPEYSSVAR